MGTKTLKKIAKPKPKIPSKKVGDSRIDYAISIYSKESGAINRTMHIPRYGSTQIFTT